MESQQITVIRSLRTPRAAAIAGVLFAVLLSTVLVLLKLTALAQPGEVAPWVSSERVSFALSLVPFAGIAFLWLIGVVRDRIGEHEDRFFATVFLGSGLLFVALLFVASGIAAGVLEDAASAQPRASADTFELCRRIAAILLHTYAMRMAAVFMMSTATIGVRTGFMPRWLALSGFVIAAILLLGIGLTRWVELLFPLWIMLFSLNTLFHNLRGLAATAQPAT
jgi:hypothetical protein